MALIDDLVHAHRLLRECTDTAALVARAGTLARSVGGFDRAVLALVADGELRAYGSVPMDDAPSDALRRRLLADPVPLRAGTEESELVRRPTATRRRRLPSDVAEHLGLDHWSMGPVAPDGATLALLVADRAEPLDDASREALRGFCLMLGHNVEHFVLRRRAAELAEEVRQFAGSAQALAQDVLGAPVALPAEYGLGLAMPRATVGARASSTPMMARLSARERRIAELLIDGRSNREIADVLVLSPETVKTHVARILRKVGAGNRVEAVTRLLAS